jgi:hypothetical protein
LFLILVVVALFPIGAQAQNNISFSSVAVEIWPEFDQPSVLVIYHYNLGADVNMPANLTLRVPIQATINAVAVNDGTGTLISTNYERTISGDWAVLTLTSTSRDIQVEYYDQYIRQGDIRQYEFVWPGNYPADAFSVNFQQPMGSTALRLTPELGVGVVAADGLTYYNSMVGAMPVNQTFTLSIEYQKTTDTLSASGQSVQPSAPLADPTNLTDVLPWVLGGLGAILVMGGLVVGLVYWRREKEKTPGNSRKRRASTQQETPGEDAYCNQCGKRAQPGDVFCRSCGSRLRRSN